MNHFGDQLAYRIKELQNPTVVGLDPRLDKIPNYLKQEAINKFDKTPQAAAEAIWMFNQSLIDTVSDIVPAVKLQSAFYECYGHHGFEVYERTIAHARRKGLLVIGDSSQASIGSAAESCAEGQLGLVDLFGAPTSALNADAVTVNPYLGSDAINPFVKVCKEQGKGIFVVVRTSNESSDEVQGQAVGDELVDEVVANLVEGWGRDLIGESGFSSVGAVVGSPYPEEARELRNRMPNQLFLVPEYNPQAGGAEEARPCFHANGTGAVVHSSERIIFAYLDDKMSERAYAEAARAAALRMKDDLNRLF